MADVKMKQHMVEQFASVYGDANGVEVYFAPGRVNMIGEHTDYNGGHVFPCALTIGTYAAARKNNLKMIRVYSENFDQLGIIETNLDTIEYNKVQDFANYPFGVVKTLLDAGYQINEGMDICYYGNIPNSSGLSSSASIEVLTAFVARELFGFSIDFVTMSLLTQKAENQFIGVNCGIMDQFAIAMGKENHAIFLDTSNLEYQYAPIVLENAKIVIACSNKKRGLGDSKYNERRSQCEAALAKLQTVKKISSLGDLTIEEFEELKDVIEDEVLTRRAKHAVYENQRTIQAVKALEEKDLKLFGKLMVASHDSLRDDYEVTGIELDTLVEEALKQTGVIGSRMTGAGFGGCTVSIVTNEYIDSFINKVGAAYQEKIGYAADFYIVDVGCGPLKLA
jgi:galactokinase